MAEGTTKLTDQFSEALEYATRLHATQRRKISGTPYVGHVLGVAALVLEYGADEREAIAALLHDAIEDQGGAATREEIRRRFGEKVVAIVDGCTDTDVKPKPPWRQRKEAYLRRLRGESASVRLVVACDKLQNVRALLREYRAGGESIWALFRGGREGTLWYYRSVVEALREGGTSPPTEELQRAVEQLESLTSSRTAVGSA